MNKILSQKRTMQLASTRRMSILNLVVKGICEGNVINLRYFAYREHV